jgi:predicted metal-binding membrane protein
MGRAVLLVVVAAVATLAFATAALAVSGGGGQSATAPGQVTAAAQCGIGKENFGTIDRQVAAGIQAGGGPKSVDVAPTNCDHFWQTSGAIGNSP